MTDAACGAGIPGMGSDVSVFPPVGVGIASGRGAFIEVTAGAGGTENVERDAPVSEGRLLPSLGGSLPI